MAECDDAQPRPRGFGVRQVARISRARWGRLQATPVGVPRCGPPAPGDPRRAGRRGCRPAGDAPRTARAQAGRRLHPPGPVPRTGRSRRRGSTSWRCRQRIPQVTALDDPTASNTIYPIPSVAPAVFLDGLQPVQPDARPAVPLVRHAPAPGRGRRAGRAGRPGRAGRGRSSTRSPTSSGRITTSTYNERAEAILSDNRKLASDFVDDRRDRGTRRATAPSRTSSAPRWPWPTSTAS